MTLADDLKPLLWEIRAIPGTLGWRPHRVFYRRSAWPTGFGEEAGEVEIETEIVEANGQPPKVRILTAQERAHTDIPDGSIEVGPITPEFPGGGSVLSKILGDDVVLQDGETFVFRVSGPRGDNFYVRSRVFDDAAMNYRLWLVPVGSL